MDCQHDWNTVAVKEEHISYENYASNSSNPKEADLERPRLFSCLQCENTFTSSAHLKVHRLVHRGEKHLTALPARLVESLFLNKLV